VFEELRWDNERLDHIAEHNVTIDEVLEVLESSRFFSPRWRRDKRYVFGQTEAGRYLFIVVGRRRTGELWLVTARDMNERERRLYGRRAEKGQK